MMTEEDKAMIAKWVDGSLDGDPREAEIREMLANDPNAKAYAEKIERSNRLIRAAFEAPMRQPMPAGLRATLFGRPGKVAILRRPRVWVPAAIAASLVLAVGIGLLAPSTGTQIAALGDAPPGGALHMALETLPSGTLSEAGVQPMLTFLDRDGRACREFEVIGELPNEVELGIACRQPTGVWHVEIVVAAPVADAAPEGDGLAPASGGPAEATLETIIDALGAGPALGPAEEAALLANSWQAR